MQAFMAEADAGIGQMATWAAVLLTFR